MPEDLDELKLAVENLPGTSADAERGFSTVNILCNPLRNRLGVQRLSSMIFVSLVGLTIPQASHQDSAIRRLPVTSSTPLCYCLRRPCFRSRGAADLERHTA